MSQLNLSSVVCFLFVAVTVVANSSPAVQTFLLTNLNSVKCNSMFSIQWGIKTKLKTVNW